MRPPFSLRYELGEVLVTIARSLAAETAEAVCVVDGEIKLGGRSIGLSVDTTGAPYPGGPKILAAMQAAYALGVAYTRAANHRLVVRTPCQCAVCK